MWERRRLKPYGPPRPVTGIALPLNVHFHRQLLGRSTIYRVFRAAGACRVEIVIYYNVINQMAFIELACERYSDSNILRITNP
jgi:hypothetical protein